MVRPRAESEEARCGLSHPPPSGLVYAENRFSSGAESWRATRLNDGTGSKAVAGAGVSRENVRTEYFSDFPATVFPARDFPANFSKEAGSWSISLPAG